MDINLLHYIFVPISNRFARRRDWYRDTGKTCLGGGMHCLSVSSLWCHFWVGQSRWKWCM